MNECMNCSKLFVPCRNSQGKYCSRSCSASRNNKLFPKRQPGPTARKKAKPAVQKWLDGEWDGTVKSGLSSAIRRHLIEQAGEKCEQCGWSGVNPKSGKTTLTVDHTDGDSKNNRAENLKVLCPNCHSLTPKLSQHRPMEHRTPRSRAAFGPDSFGTDVLSTMVSEEIPTLSLNHPSDRCDRCGSEAFFIFFKADMRLNLCGHHGNNHRKAAEANDWQIVDEYHMINESPSVSANAE